MIVSAEGGSGARGWHSADAWLSPHSDGVRRHVVDGGDGDDGRRWTTTTTTTATARTTTRTTATAATATTTLRGSVRPEGSA
eukprot:2963280-Pyramimonas_sp.AAC.1